MATFTYLPDWGASPELEPGLRSVRFGDGYEQRAPNGLNPILPTWKLQFTKRTQAEAQAIYSWMIAHSAQVTAFDWAAPGEGTAAGERFATGDGGRMTFSLAALSRPCTLVGTPTIHRTDWQGTYQLFSTARTNYATTSEPLLANLSSRSAGVIQGSLTDYGLTNGVTFPAVAQLDYAYEAHAGIVNGATVTAVFFVKMADLSAPSILATDAGSDFRIQFGSVVQVSGVVTISALGGGLYRVQTTVASLAGVANTSWGIVRGASGTGKSFTVTGYQLYMGSISGSYIKTTTVPVTVTDYTINSAGLVTLVSTANPVMAQNLGTASGSTATFAVVTPNGSTPTVVSAWRTDWQGRQRVYPTARTNRALRSEELGNASWTATSMTVQNDMTTAPDGSALAEKLIPVAASSAHRIQHSLTGITAGQVFTESIFVKANGYNKVCLREGSTSGAYAAFDLSAVTVLDAGSGGSGTITALPSGWYRLTLTSVAGASSRMDLHVLSAGYTTGDPTVSWTGDGTSAVYAWGAQAEAGALATAYIPTTSVAVTVTDWSQSASNVVFASNPLAGAVIEADYTYIGGLGVGSTLTWTGTYTRKHVAKFGVPKPDGYNSWSITADFREVPI